MTLDEIRATEAYRRGWDLYQIFNNNGRKFPEGTDTLLPYEPNGIEAELWFSGANSSYGQDYYTGMILGLKPNKIPAHTPPILSPTRPVHVQLDLF